MKSVFLVYGMIDVSDYINGEGDFFLTQRMWSLLYAVQKKLQKKLYRKEKNRVGMMIMKLLNLKFHEREAWK